MSDIKFLDEIEFEKKHKELIFEELERTIRNVNKYRKEKRDCQKWLLPFLNEIGKENIKRVTIKNKKGLKLWDFSAQ